MPFQCRKVVGTPGFLIAAWLSAILLLLIVGRPQLTPAQEAKGSQHAAKAGSNTKLVARGKYIVEGVAGCGYCHTPRDKDGNLDHTKWLAGAPVFYEPAQRVAGWAITAPRIAGSPPGSDVEMITLLTTGVSRNGRALRPPMPDFHMTRTDAEAVVAYLKSLGPGQ
jgi:mono/diheme cytochrome c family protein